MLLGKKITLLYVSTTITSCYRTTGRVEAAAQTFVMGTPFLIPHRIFLIHIYIYVYIYILILKTAVYP